MSLKLIEQPAKLRTVGLGSADMHVAENLPASGFGQLPGLGVNALAFSARRYPCITVFHGGNYAANLRSKKAQSFQLSHLAERGKVAERRFSGKSGGAGVTANIFEQ
jgi:hypothetical protein